MAKKPKKAEEPEVAAPPEDGQEVKPGRLRKLAIFGGIGLAALSALAGGGYWFFANGKGETGEAPKNAAPVAFLDIREMTSILRTSRTRIAPRS